MDKKFISKNNLRLALWAWVFFSFFLTVIAALGFFNKSLNTSDIGVSLSQTTCTGGCVYFGVKPYPNGTLCRGIRPGDPDGLGGLYQGADFSSKCYKCSNGSFVEQSSVSSCNVCYGKCLGDPTATVYNSGNLCAVGSGANYGIYRCVDGIWEKTDPAQKCAGGCPGDPLYSLYNLGHVCYTENTCFQCTSPGREFQGGFDAVDDAACAAVKPTQASCRGKCQFDSLEREYHHGQMCQSGAGSSVYGTYVCNNGQWEKTDPQKCVGQAPGDRPGTLYDLGFKFLWLNRCFQCAAPGRELQGGFDEVDVSICGVAGGTGNPGHALKDACLGDLNASGSIDLNDYALFARNYNLSLGELWYYDIVDADVKGVLNLNDYAKFARNYEKNTSNCEKRTVELTR